MLAIGRLSWKRRQRAEPAAEPIQSEKQATPTGLLNVDSAAKSFGTTRALDGLTLNIQSSERVALLGPNGAGKTTLVRAISGRVRLDSGTIRIAGDQVGHEGGHPQLGVVPQDLALYGDLTARENLMVMGKLHGLARQKLQDRVAWALKWIGLEDRQHDLVRTFSGGMKRRVNIAASVLHSPTLLLLDEPTVGVDPQSRQRIFEMLDELHRSGMTLVLTTHHMDEAEEQCDRVIIVDHGRVIADGTLSELIGRTIGEQRQVAMEIGGEFVARIDGLTCDSDRNVWLASVGDITDELPGLLDAVRACGGIVNRLEVHEPTLHEVFLHLTGRELRE